MEQIRNITLENMSATISLEKFNRICRLCFSESNIKPFFELHFKGMSLFKIYQEITMLQIKEGDCLPEHACMDCIEKIVYIFVFIKNCQQTDEVLRSITTNSKTNMILLKQGTDMVHGMEKESIERTNEPALESNSNLNSITIMNMQSVTDHYSTKDGITSSSKLENKMQTEGKQIETNLKFTNIHKVIEPLPKLTGPPFMCNICSESYETLSEFKQHLKRSKKCLPRKYSCSLCARRFVNKAKVQIHMRTHTNEKPFACDVCDEKFRYAQNLIRHKIKHTGEKPFSCDICGKRFSKSTSKIEHMRLHTGELPFLCSYCGRTFSKVSGLRLHTLKHKLQSGEPIQESKKISKEFVCSKCPKQYVLKTMLYDHEQTHHSGSLLNNENMETDKHLCSTCGKTYATKTTLAVHGSVHSNIKSHFCSLCEKAFCYKSSLRSHMLIHTGVRPHKCTVCNKTFVQNIHLTQHMRTHTGEKPNVCNFCGKCFALKGNLIVHKRKHTGETPFHCSNCNRGFPDSSSMKKHLRTHKSKFETIYTLPRSPL